MLLFQRYVFLSVIGRNWDKQLGEDDLCLDVFSPVVVSSVCFSSCQTLLRGVRLLLGETKYL